MNVFSVLEALAWYEQTLGFQRSFVVPGDDPPYAVLERDGLCVHLRKHQTAAGTSFCYLVVDDVQRWSDDLTAKGANFRRRLEASSYGMRDFELIDCCGNLIGIGETIG
jgi:uncharacterized glyoxalase superfamily protein PhnB